MSDLNQSAKGLVIILSSPSGGGKSSLAKALLKGDQNLVLSVSATTRKPRPGDVDGVHYHFKTKEEFLKMVNNNELLEYSEIYGNLYGIPKNFVYDQINQGKDILFDIDYQGASKLKKILKDMVVSIFVLPPSIEELRKRLKARAQDSDDEIESRLALAQAEMVQAKNYDHIVTNEDFEITLKNLQEIIREEKHRHTREESRCATRQSQ